MTTTPARHPHHATGAGVDGAGAGAGHPKNAFPPIEAAWTRTGHHPALRHQRRFA
jgi:hypothetical protein